MALQKCGLNVNRASRELQAHGTIEFPCAGYASSRTEKAEDIIPWHWHEEMEMIYLKEGRLDLKIPSKKFAMKAGDCAVINSNILHYAAAVNSCRLCSLVFSPKLIAGDYGAVFFRQYLQPLISSSSFSGYLIPDENISEIAGCFQKAFDALARDDFGYEFTVRENLSSICLFLYRQFYDEIQVKTAGSSLDSSRIKIMLAYIHKNFADNLTLADIAKAADIGERECLRCFQRTIQLSPVQYLLKYRIMQGAKMILQEPEKSISETAALCGFDSPSNFSKMFKRFYQCTPKQYKNLKEVSS